MIVPTVGRKVWYRPDNDDIFGTGHDTVRMEVNGEDPLDATVIAVWADCSVNLDVCDIDGRHHFRRRVLLLAEDDDRRQWGGFAEWMPYQIAQAKKHEAVDTPAPPLV